jgi:hypothetical protein
MQIEQIIFDSLAKVNLRSVDKRLEGETLGRMRMSMQIGSPTSISVSQYPTSRASDAGTEPVVGVPFSARVGAKTYSANVEQMANEYEGRVANLFGASTIGSTVGQVENNLSNLISFFA